MYAIRLIPRFLFQIPEGCELFRLDRTLKEDLASQTDQNHTLRSLCERPIDNKMAIVSDDNHCFRGRNEYTLPIEMMRISKLFGKEFQKVNTILFVTEGNSKKFTPHA